MAETSFWKNILYKSSESQYKKHKTIGYNVYGDLKINELLDYCCRQYPGLAFDDLIKYTLEIIKYPCQIREDIEYRQQIFSQILEKKEHCDKLYELFREVNILYKIKETYDNRDIVGEYSEYLASVNNIFFIKSYQLFLSGIKDYMESMNIKENYGLYYLYEYIKNSLAELNAKEIIPTIDRFAAIFKKKQTVIAELPYFKNVFSDYNFDYKGDYKGYDVPENCFLQNLKNVEDFMEIKNSEKDHKFVDISDFKYIRYSPSFNNFEKRTLLNMFEAAENEGVNIAEPIQKIKEIQDAIDISGLVEISEQLKFYLCMCKVINFINEVSDNYLCFPTIDDGGKKADISDMFDPVVLIQKHSEQRELAYKTPNHEVNIGEIITNNISFDDFGVFIITGANNGGKTSFVRAMGICVVLYGAGCPIPAKKAKFKTGLVVHTHFATEETHIVESGRLQDELRRVNEILEQCDNSSVVIFNETYVGTNAGKALELFEGFLREAKKSRLSGFFVTHFHNIALHADDVQTGENISPEGNGGFDEEKTALYSACVNLKALVDEKTGKRTFKVVPYKPSDSSYSREIVEKHRLTWEHMAEYLNVRESGKQL